MSVCWRCGDEEATQFRGSEDHWLPSKNICFDCAKLFDAETRGDVTMEFLIKVIAPDTLRQKDIIEDIRSGLHYHDLGSGDPNDPYLMALRQVKLKVSAPRRTVKKLKKSVSRGGAE